MKRLIVLRHAKADAKDAARDFERVLAPRGRADMKAVSAYLAEEGLIPDLALVSPAARTRETWTLAHLPEVPVSFEPAIYEASAATLLQLVREKGGSAASLALVGHNPGLEDLAALLTEGRIGRHSITVPTGTLVVIDFTSEDWAGIAPGAGRLDRLVTPADLGAGRDAWAGA